MKIIPVSVNAWGTYVARAPIVRAFDTNAAGELLEVPFAFNPVDAVEIKLQFYPAGQVYVEIDE